MSDRLSARLRTRFGAHIETCRPDTVFYAGLVGLGAAFATDPHAPANKLLLAWAAPTLGWIASLYGGDYFDRQLDALSKPHRPIPSGRLTARTARRVMIVTIAAGFVIATLANPLSVALAVPAAVIGIAYSYRLKGRGIWGNLARGVPTAITVAYGSMAVQTLPDPRLTLVALALFAHDAQSNLLGALCDRDSDRQGGYYTYPATRGDAPTLTVLTILQIYWGIVLVVWVCSAGTAHQGVSAALYLVPALALNGYSMSIVWRSPRPVPRAFGIRAHEIVVVERLVLAAAVLAWACGPAFAATVVVPALGLTLVARSRMRTKYQPQPAVKPAGNP